MGTEKKLTEIFNKLTSEEKKIIYEYIMEILRTTMFSMLGIFEENEQFKLIYEENGKQVDLMKISETLKAEPIIENG